MSKLRVGVIGLGMMGQRHCRVYSALRNAQLAGVADLNTALGQMVAASHDTAYFQNWEELLANVDAISVVTTTPAHFKLVRRAIECGVHVLVEKPITETVAQGRELVALAEHAGVVFQVGHIERFNPTYMELKKIVSEMPLISVNMRRLSPFDASKTDVDVIRDLMIHDLDLMTDLLGRDFEPPHSLGRSIATDAVDHAIASFSFRSGPLATLMASRITEQKVRMIEVIADGAYIEADLLGKSLIIHHHTFSRYVDNQTASTYRQESLIERIHVPMMEPLVLELEHFVDCVRHGRPTNVPGRDGLAALELAHMLIDQINPPMLMPNDQRYKVVLEKSMA
jgi:predicted dehydrogenase